MVNARPQNPQGQSVPKSGTLPQLIRDFKYESVMQEDNGNKSNPLFERRAETNHGSLLSTWIWLIPAWISNCIYYSAMDEITKPFLNFNDVAVEVWNG